MTEITLITGVTLTLISIAFKLNPPKKINQYYGYRTNAARRSQETWDAGNSYSTKLLMFSGIVLIAIGVASLFLPDMEKVGDYIGLGLVFLSIIVPILLTERFLNKHFDKEGKIK